MLNISSYAKKAGIDAAIAFTVLARIVQAGGGLITIVFVARYLNIVEQGYYFTFGSILAIQIFFEMGLSNIITQFVAHEIAHLHWKDEIRLEGSAKAMSRLSYLLRFCLKWFSLVGLVLFFILMISGFVFFNKYGKGSTTIEWQEPWIILSISTALSLMISPILSFFEGLGKVKEVAKIRLIQQICQLSVLLLLLLGGLKLYASPIAAIVTFIIAPLWILFSTKKKLLEFIWAQLGEWSVSYRLEIFPYQWRIALSWISGYFMYQLFNPVLFATEGPKVAGQMGLTLAALNGVLSISVSWVNTKVPLFSSLIAKKEFEQLDKTFNKTILNASVICVLCLVMFIGGVIGLQYFKPAFGDRFLPLLPLVLLCSTTFVNQLVSAWATYLRCHKQEPFLVFSIVLAILTALSTFILGNKFGLNGIVYGYTTLTVGVSLIWSFTIFKLKKKEWH